MQNLDRRYSDSVIDVIVNNSRPKFWPKWAEDMYDERAAIREIDGEQDRETAEKGAIYDVRVWVSTYNRSVRL